MSEYRRDPVVDRWVIIAPDRAARPHDFVETATVARRGPCPFCAGNEHLTTAEVDAVREADDATAGSSVARAAWRVRAVTNKFPFLDSLGATSPSGEPPLTTGSGSFGPAVGRHEVLIEAPFHAVRASELSVAHAADVLRLYQSRLQAIRAEKRWRYVQIFRNVGEAAGASLEHLHSQLAALDRIPPCILDELRWAGEYRKAQGRCIYCDLIAAESADGRRTVETTPEFAVVCPYASRFSYEMAIYPRRHAADFDSISDTELAALADVLQRTLTRVESLSPRTAYNVLLHTAPFAGDERYSNEADAAYHWHLAILPRTAQAAGFEWSTGIFVNAVAPEAAARRLRGD